MVREQRHRERNLRKKKDGMSTATSENDSSTSGARRSSRRAKEVVAKTVEDEGDWVFDCVCGENGINYVGHTLSGGGAGNTGRLTDAHQDDGTEIIACDSCDVWQHLKCQHLAPGGEKDDFICDMCSRYRQGEKGLGQSPQIIKLRVSPLSPVKSSAASVGVSRELETGVAGERAKP